MPDISAGKKVTDAFVNQIHLYGKPEFKSLDEFVTDALNERYKQGCLDQELLTKSITRK